MIWRIAFQIIPVAAWGVAVAAGVLPLKLSRRASLFAMLALAVAFGKFAFFAIVGGHGFNPDLPQGVIWAYGCTYATAMLFAFFATVAFFADLALGAFRHRVSLRAKRVRAVAMAVFAAALAGWGICEGVCIPRVKRVEISLKELPAAFDGYRIVHLTDLHCSSAARRARFEAIVERVNALEPDMVAITGDFVDGKVEERERDLEPLANLKASDGVWGCTGNHEAYWDWRGWSEALARWNVRMLSERTVQLHPDRVIRRGGDVMVLGGLQDPAFGHSPNIWPDARDAFRGAPTNAFRVLLFHRPVTDAVCSAAADVRLQLSGHTHGGAMPVLRWLVEYTNEGHSRGVYEFAPDRFLHVSAGTGQWAGFPLRLFTPAEITEVTLRRCVD